MGRLAAVGSSRWRFRRARKDTVYWLLVHDDRAKVESKRRSGEIV